MNLWSPPDTKVLPSKDEIQEIKRALLDLEKERLEAQLKVVTLTRAICEYKAWIAPIRFLPQEITSHIFVEYSMDDWKAPLILQSVCRNWHSVIHDTPRAWSFIPTRLSKYCGHKQMLPAFLARSKATPLHMAAFDFDRRSEPEARSQILDQKSRIMCLRTLVSELKLFIKRDADFTILEHLEIMSEDRISPLDWPRFDLQTYPRLQSLKLNLLTSTPSSIASLSEFPAIRELSILTSDPTPLKEILEKCSISLELLDLRFRTPARGQTSRRGNTILNNLPRLTQLQLDGASILEGKWSLKAKTPALEVYLQFGTSAVMDETTANMQRVRVLTTYTAPNLSMYPHLEDLHFYLTPRDFRATLHQLGCSHRLCPKLSSISYGFLPVTEPGDTELTLQEMEQTLKQCAEARGKPIKFTQMGYGYAFPVLKKSFLVLCCLGCYETC